MTLLRMGLNRSLQHPQEPPTFDLAWTRALVGPLYPELSKSAATIGIFWTIVIALKVLGICGAPKILIDPHRKVEPVKPFAFWAELFLFEICGGG